MVFIVEVEWDVSGVSSVGVVAGAFSCGFGDDVPMLNAGVGLLVL
jgi:hypothetical protein